MQTTTTETAPYQAAIIKTSALIALVAKVQDTAEKSKDRLTEWCGGVRLSFGKPADGKPYLQAVATDGHRMVVAQADLSAVSEAAWQSQSAAIVRIGELVELVRILKKGGHPDGWVNIETGEHVWTAVSRVDFSPEQRFPMAVCAPLASFPPYEKVRPTSYVRDGLVNRLAALKLAKAHLASEGYKGGKTGASKAVVFVWDGNEATMSSDVGGKLPVGSPKSPAKPLRIGLDAKYVVEALSQIRTETVVICANSPKGNKDLDPMCLQSLDGRDEHVIIPMRIS